MEPNFFKWINDVFAATRPLTLKSGNKTWPPFWITSSGDNASGEIGILEDVLGVLEDVLIDVVIPTTLFLFIEFQGSRYVGSMSFDDSISCQKIYDLLKPNVGRSMKEIGDLEVPS